jgi:hypothetical protein
MSFRRLVKGGMGHLLHCVRVKGRLLFCSPHRVSLSIISVFRYISFMLVVIRICVGTYVENDSKCDLATESRSMSDINRTLDAYVMRCSRMIYKYHFLAQYKELRSPI